MRFIITKEGETLVKVFEQEESEERNKKTQLLLTQTLSQQYNEKTRNRVKSMDSYNKNTLLTTDIRRPKFSHTKQIDIKQKKLNIPKPISDKYSQSQDYNTFLIPEIPKILNFNENKRSSISNFFNKTSFKLEFPLKDIIQSDTIMNLKQKINNEKKKLKGLNNTQSNFRTIYQAESETNRIKSILNETRLDTGKINFINYLSHKKNITQQFLENIRSFSEIKFAKINKICQRQEQIDQEEQIKYKLRKDKIKNKYIKEENDGFKILNEIDDNIKFHKSIVNGYEKIDENKHKEKFRELYKDYQKGYWKKFKVDHLQRKLQK